MTNTANYYCSSSLDYLSPPDSESTFQFPFKPYDIQISFMKNLYQVIEEEKLGIFESPTGTGKSLSLICGALKWLKDNENRFDKLTASENVCNNENNDSKLPQWVLEHRKKQNIKDELSRKQRLNERLKKIREKEKLEREKSQSQRSRHARKRLKPIKGSEDKNYKNLNVNNTNKDIGDDDPGLNVFLVEDYDSDEDTENHSNDINDINDGIVTVVEDNLSEDVRELLKRFQEGKDVENSEKDNEIDDENVPDETKIYYCSRTHSQLSQFINELRKTDYVSEYIKSVSLGSRNSLCINENVKRFNSITKINDKCMDLQKSDLKAEKRCPHLPFKDKSGFLDFRDHVLAEVRDIEDLAHLGKKLNTCPYYGTRKSIRQCQIVTLPYNLILQKSSRESMGISLENNIVIIDEAHNLIDTITSINTVQIDLPQIRRMGSQLSSYLDRYKNRLLGKNITYIQQILSMLQALVKCLKAWQKKCENFEEDSYEGLEELNGFIEKVEQLNSDNNDSFVQDHEHLSTIPSLSQVEAFLMSLTNGNQDGRVILGFLPQQTSQVTSSSSKSELTLCKDTSPKTKIKYIPYIKYLLLNPSNQFKEIVQEARSVILAGGTMEPVNELIEQLFPYLPSEKIVKFSCGHIIPPENLLTLTVSEGPMGGIFEFTYEHRQNVKMIDELGQVIVNYCNIIPDGVICFFSSYSYLEKVYKRFETNGILKRIEKRKKVFQEPRQANLVEKTLNDYNHHIHTNSESHRGALLLCVVNGKMSVIMVGLPFANLSSNDLNEKMKFISQSKENNNSKQRGMEYYLNLSIRHQNDYATIILLDHRFNTNFRIRQKLPSWINKSVVECKKFGLTVARKAFVEL
ncbi:11292_t:CDS:10 [Entrophospora sp. SA101]|nr:11292_t:CDS:10 [Entrophospora sp. SA101]